jgi:hypothetical protein
VSTEYPPNAKANEIRPGNQVQIVFVTLDGVAYNRFPRTHKLTGWVEGLQWLSHRVRVKIMGFDHWVTIPDTKRVYIHGRS